MSRSQDQKPIGSEQTFQELAIHTVVIISILASGIFFTTSLFNFLRRGVYSAQVNTVISGSFVVISCLVLWLLKRGKFQLARYIFITAGFARAIHLLLVVPDNNFPIAVMYMTIFVVVGIFISAPESGPSWVAFGIGSILAAAFARPFLGTVFKSTPDSISLQIGNFFLPLVFSGVTSLLCFYIFKRFHAALNESIDARKRLEQSNKTLENFAYVASHDLQEPLRTITCYAQLLAQENEGKLDKDSDESIHFIVDGAQQMQRLIRDLLQYSRLKTQTSEFQSTNLNEILDQVKKNIKTSLETSETSLEIDSLPTLHAQPIQMIQLFQNLIGNAIKFHSAEKPKIILRAVEQKDHWLFSVQDNGIGIAAEHQQKVFELFQRLNAQSKYPGSGMGLAICQEIVTIHGGKIWLESEPGQGSTFFFTLPKAN